MKLSGAYWMEASRDAVFAALTDPDVLTRCIDGCERMVRTDEGCYDAHLRIGLAGLKGSYTGKVSMKDIHAPASYTLAIEGKGAPGFMRGTARILLEDRGERTEVRCESDVQVGGMIAAVGSRLIGAAGKRMMDGFFAKLSEQWRAA
jgi:hypothetical protein